MKDSGEQIVFECPCGKRYNVSARLSGRDMLCLQCSKKIIVPGERVADTQSNVEKSFESKYLFTGLGLLGAGILAGLAGWFAFSTGVASRRLWYVIVLAPVLVLMGLGSLLKWMFGRHIEWD